MKRGEIRPMVLSSLICPKCGGKLIVLVTPVITAASSYRDCLRKCEGCGVGYSNATKNPTAIWRDPIDNVPDPVRAGVLQTLNSSLNETNRTSKRIKFGFSTSEDAVTWAVFSYLAAKAPNALIKLGERWLGTPVETPTVLLWGVPILPSITGKSIRDRLVQISNDLGEAPMRRTEPDIVLDFGSKGIIIVEVKLAAKNDETTDVSKMDRYLQNTAAFVSCENIKASRLYQLTRNWRFAWDLAAQRSMRLVNLAPSSFFARSRLLDVFEGGICRSEKAAFLRESWEGLLSEVATVIEGLPDWLSEWLHTRKPPLAVGS
jgi:hypothetical protein